MLFLPHNTPITPEAYERLPILRKTWRGVRGEFRAARNVFRRSAKGRFVIFGQGRTGSTLFTSCLDNHSKIRCADEILGNPRIFPITFLENMARGCRLDFFGFHVKIYQLAAWQRVDNCAAFLSELHNRGWAIIYLRRENLLRHVLSNVFLEVAGAHHDLDGRVERPTSIHLQPDRLFNDMDVRRSYLDAERIALQGIPHLRLVYELDLENPDARQESLKRVQDFLGISHENLTSDLRKMVKSDLIDLIENYDEISHILHSRGEERFLSPHFAETIFR